MKMHARVLAVGFMNAAALVAGVAMLSGCSTYNETFKFDSDTMSPKTVSLIDTASGETVWTIDIPVGQKLIIKFDKRPSVAEEDGFDIMSWTLSKAATDPKGRANTVRVPPPSHRRLDWVLRTAGEIRN